jgi:hypothetical protein
MPIFSTDVKIKSEGVFSKKFDLRENDVFFIELVRQ